MLSASSGCKPVRGNQGDVIPAMPLLVDEDWNQVYPTGWGDRPEDPYGFGLPYRDHISRFVEGHREKIHCGARRCPFNTLIVRPVGSKERLANPKAKEAMDKE